MSRKQVPYIVQQAKQKALHYAGIISGVTFRVTSTPKNTYIVADGNTFDNKERLKARGFFYVPEGRVWAKKFTLDIINSDVLIK